MNIEELIKKTNPSTNEAVELIQAYLTDIKREDVEFAKFISHPQASKIFDFHKMRNVQGFMTNPQQMFQTINDFFNYCYNLALEHFKRKFEVDTFRVFDKNGVFMFQY